MNIFMKSGEVMNKRINRMFMSGLVTILALLSLTITDSAYARYRAPRLKDCLQTEYKYYVSSIYQLNDGIGNNSKQFSGEYDGRLVVLSGVSVKEISKNKKEITIDDGSNHQCTVKTSSTDVKNLVDRLSLGQKITVYGKISVKGIKKDTYELKAQKITEAYTQFSENSFVFYPNESYQDVLMDDLADGKTVRYYVPKAWNGQHVWSDLENNNEAKGYQYYLNAIDYNTEHAEVFYVFYFNYETNLKATPANPSGRDNRDIEELIIGNIFKNFANKPKIKIESIKDANGAKMDYSSITYRLGEDDYQLEFVFRPDRKGITCMLYLYYPKDSEVKHVREVAYLIETMSIA